MDKATVIALAREAGLKVATNIGGVTLVGSPLEGVPAIAHITIEEMERFAALVAAHEREQCAKACETQITGYHFLATHGHFDHMDQAAMNCAAAIRSRT